MYIHGHFYNEREEKVTVEIVTKGDRTEELEIGDGASGLYFGEDPAEIESQVNDTFDHLLQTQATIRLLTKNYVEDFFSSTCRDAVVNIYRGERCVFAGYIEPMALSQGYNEELDEVELTCIDCLCALEYAKYRNVGALGVLYSVVKAEADQRTFLDIMKEIMSGVTDGLDLRGTGTVHFYYDGSKAVDETTANRYTIFERLSINELLFMGDEEDDVWTQNEVVEEMLKYLNLHIVQEGLDFYIYSWETVKGDEKIAWRDIFGGGNATTERTETEITTALTVDADTTISVGEVYNQLQLTCNIESVESLVESPLDDDLVKSPYSNKQKYMTEYSADGEGKTAINAFDAMIHGTETTYEDGCVTDWYVQVMENSQWTFPNKGEGDLIDQYCQNNRAQQTLPNLFPQQPAAAIIALGKVEKSTDGKDNSPTSKIDMTNYLVVSVNGNGLDGETTAYPNQTSLKTGMPCAVYNGGTSGGVFSPTDEGTTNYIVLSGKIVMNPLMKLTDTYKALYDYVPTVIPTPFYTSGINQWWHQTVPSRNNDDGRYYTQQWWEAETPQTTPTWARLQTAGLVPYIKTGPEEYEFQYSAKGDGSDHISKVAVLACMLVIGDKCVVESGTEGQVTDFEWRTYKTLEECKDEDEYYQQSFTIGFDPKIGDKLIGTKFDFQNNISYELGLDTEGIAIPIKKCDKVSGRVQFKILGPVNTLFDVVTRRHPTWFRHTKWNSTSVPLLAHVSNILLEKFEVKIYSDNGLVNNTGDSDIVYISDTKETYVNKKDDLEMKISSALTTEECRALDVTDSIKMSTPLDTKTGEGVTAIYDHNRGESGKPEQQYVDSYWQEWHAPRIVMTQNLVDTEGGAVSLFGHYRNGAMKNRTFFVQSISRNLGEGYAEMTLKEIDQ